MNRPAFRTLRLGAIGKGSSSPGQVCILMRMGREAAIGERAEPFITTHWTLVLAAGQSSPQARIALDQLCRSYWYPLYAYVRRKGHDEHEAQDLTQEFFARLLSRNNLAGLHPSQGKFRAFLLAAVNHFLANEWRRSHTLKRGGGVAVLPLDLAEAEASYAQESDSFTPERLFDRRWAQGILDRAARALRDEYVVEGRERIFEELNRFLSIPASDGEYSTASVRLGLASGTVAWTVHRMRQRFAELVRQAVAQTVSTPLEIEGEIRYLLEVMSANPVI